MNSGTKNKKVNKNRKTRIKRQNRHKNCMQNKLDERLYEESRLDRQTLEGQIRLPVESKTENKGVLQRLKTYIYENYMR